MILMTRRQTLAAITVVVAASPLLSCSDNNATVSAKGYSDLEILSSVAYDLFPHKALSPDLYLQVGQRLLRLDSSVVSQGLLQLQSEAGNRSWIDVSESERLSVLKSIEKSEFFALLRSVTIDVLYHDSAMFELVGYGGSAIEKGGYINRGFDDINWLPKGEATQ